MKSPGYIVRRPMNGAERRFVATDICRIMDLAGWGYLGVDLAESVGDSVVVFRVFSLDQANDQHRD